MPTRSTIASAAALVFGAVSAAAAQTWTKVRIGTKGAYPPWNHADTSGELIGSRSISRATLVRACRSSAN